MNRIRRRLTYANVASSIALFLALTGATAFAATQLAKNSVGTKQLKNNAVTTAKIKKNAINAAKLKANAVTTAKLKKNAVTGAKIKASTTPFSRVTARLRNTESFSFESKEAHPVGSYTQPAGESDQFLAAMQVTFAPGCAAPRQAVALLEVNPSTTTEVDEGSVAAAAIVIDTTGASATHTLNFSPVAPAAGSMTGFESETDQSHSFYVVAEQAKCASGSGVTGSDLGLDVIGTK